MEERYLKESFCLISGAALLGYFWGGLDTACLAGIVAFICIGRASRWMQLQEMELRASVEGGMSASCSRRL